MGMGGLSHVDEDVALQWRTCKYLKNLVGGVDIKYRKGTSALSMYIKGNTKTQLVYIFYSFF